MEEQGKGADGSFIGGRSAGNGTSGTPDINTILAELAQYSSAQQESNQAQIPSTYEQQQWMQHQQSASLQAISAERSLDPRQHSYHRDQLSRSPLIDPSTILEWPQALRCVNKLSTQNPNFGPTIKVVSEVLETNLRFMLTTNIDDLRSST